MTIRAVILGLLGAAIILCLNYLLQDTFLLTGFTSGGLMPVGVLVLMLLGALLVGLAGRGRRWGRFQPGELAAIFLLLTTACGVLGGGVPATFTPVLLMPVDYNEQRPSWRKNRLLDYVPPAMLVADGKYDAAVVQGFLGGLGDQNRRIGLSDVPWRQWTGPLVTWLPLIGLVGVCMTSIGLIVHRQWSQRELLRYPIAEFAGAMLSGRTEGGGPLYTNRMFLAGFIAVFAVFFINGLHRWFPGGIEIPLSYSFWQVGQKWPIFNKAPFADHLTGVHVSFIAIAFSFYLSSEVALSLAVSQMIYVPLGMLMLTLGVDLTSDFMEGGATAWQRFGSYVGFGLMLLYFGRRYYWRLLVAAFTFRRDGLVAAYEAWAARVLLAATAAIILIACRLGMAWTLALLSAGMMLLLLVIVSRIGAETGLFDIQARWQPLGVLLGCLGLFALGPKMIILVGLFCTMLTLTPGGMLAPFFVNSLRVCSRLGVRPAHAGLSAGGLYLGGICLAAVVMLWVNYNFGIDRRWDNTVRAPTMSFQPAERASTKLAVSGELEASLRLSPVQRLVAFKPSGMFLWSAGLGFAAVIVFSALRLRFSWWPLHPVMFLVWATWPMGQLTYSFLLGWLVRTVVIRLAGHQGYQQTKPLMIGAIAGNLVGEGLWMVVALAYYEATGLVPPSQAVSLQPLLTLCLQAC